MKNKKKDRSIKGVVKRFAPEKMTLKVIYGKINLIYQYFQNIRVSLFLYIKLLTVKTTV